MELRVSILFRLNINDCLILQIVFLNNDIQANTVL